MLVLFLPSRQKMEKSSDFFECVTGECLSMCPDCEITLRINERLVHQLEKSLQNGRLMPDPQIMVKEYSRPAAGKVDPRPNELRPPEVLLTTVDYLLGSVTVRTDIDWKDIYDFVFDRLRCVRQDMVIQDIGGSTGITILERIVRFHVYSGYRLCTEPMARFDPKINNQHLQECLKRLLYLYSTVPGCHDNRSEFESIYLLYNLGQTDALMHYYDLDTDYRNCDIIQQSYRASIEYMLGNHVRCLRFALSQHCKQYPILLCSLHHHLADIQRQALQKMSTAYSSKLCKYPVVSLRSLLLFTDDDHVIKECRSCGLDVDEDEMFVQFQKNKCNPSEKVKRQKLQLIEDRITHDNLSTILMNKNKT